MGWAAGWCALYLKRAFLTARSTNLFCDNERDLIPMRLRSFLFCDITQCADALRKNGIYLEGAANFVPA
jgi:hypothetical protein